MNGVTKRIYFPRLISYYQHTKPVWLSGVSTKLAADGLVLSDDSILFLSQSIGFYYKKQNHSYVISAIHPSFWNYLSISLGLYFEDFRTVSLDRLFADIKKNLRLRITPPMLEVPKELISEVLDEKLGNIPCMLLVVGVTSDDEALVLIHPSKPSYFTLDRSVLENWQTKQHGTFCWRWVMLNSPSFARPVFPDLRQSHRITIDTWIFRSLFLPKLPSSIGISGRQAFEECIEELQTVSRIGSDYNTPILFIRSLQQAVDEGLGNQWGRHQIARALRDFHTKLEPIAQKFDDLAVRWQYISTLIQQIRMENYSDSLLSIADMLSAIKEKEMNALRQMRNFIKYI